MLELKILLIIISMESQIYNETSTCIFQKLLFIFLLFFIFFINLKFSKIIECIVLTQNEKWKYNSIKTIHEVQIVFMK